MRASAKPWEPRGAADFGDKRAPIVMWRFTMPRQPVPQLRVLLVKQGIECDPLCFVL